jgi:hypothetical protein
MQHVSAADGTSTSRLSNLTVPDLPELVSQFDISGIVDRGHYVES